MKARYAVPLLAFIVGAGLASLFTLSDLALAHIAEWSVYACLPAANGFLLWYGTTRPWYRSQIGRALMTKAFGVAALFDLSAVAHAFAWQVPAEVAVLVIGTVVIGVWYQFLVLCFTPLSRPMSRPDHEGEQP